MRTSEKRSSFLCLQIYGIYDNINILQIGSNYLKRERRDIYECEGVC